MPRGRLSVVGTGYIAAGQVTQQALACLQRSEKVFHLVPDATTAQWLQEINPSAESLADSYGEGKERMDSYNEMVERILAPVRTGLRVCAAFYGHPGVCAFPGHESVRRARGEGFEARMLPGISSVDCLYADLGVDPGTSGCQMYEASAFLYQKRRYDPAIPLILWQIGYIGVTTHRPETLWGPRGLRVLVQVLLQDYPADHEVVVYEAAELAFLRSRVLRVPLGELAESGVTGNSTLYVPPRQEVEYDWDVVERIAPTQDQDDPQGGDHV
jgi:uncharacterized protein YabN with tetrapyrrole methylase and pyrophosphatase domain